MGILSRNKLVQLTSLVIQKNGCKYLCRKALWLTDIRRDNLAMHKNRGGDVISYQTVTFYDNQKAVQPLTRVYTQGFIPKG